MSLRPLSLASLLSISIGVGLAGCGDSGNGGGAAQAGQTNSAGFSPQAGSGGALGAGGSVNPGGGGGNGNPSGGNVNGAGQDPGGGQAPGGAGGQSPGGSAGQATGGSAGDAPGGAGGSGGASAGSGGSGGGGSGGPTGVKVTSHDLAVPSGKVFNVADNYFNDGFIPATPIANFGLHSQIIAVASDDGSLDVAWLDYTSGNGRPWALDDPAMIYLTHVDASLTSATTVASGVSTYKLLGFTKDAAGASYLAYNKDHSFKSDTQGNPNRIDGNELHITKLSGGSAVWDQLVFGNQDNAALDSLGDPGGAASGVLGYDATNQRVVTYLGHSMRWNDGVRHQAGFLRLLDASTGAVQQPGGGADKIHFGSGWFYSHNFNQRLIVDGSNYYVLAHGDAYARQLGFARWSNSGYVNDNDTDFDASYFNIAGNVGDNETDSQTGQFVKMPDGRFLIVHTTSQTRSARDVRLIFANGSNGTANTAGAVWLTTNQGTTHATMPKVELLGDYVLVTYALWNSAQGHALTWYAALLNASLTTVVAPKAIAGIEFVDSAPLFRFKGGPNTGKVGWVSGNASHTLSVRVAEATN